MHTETARSIVKALVGADLIRVRDHHEAAAALAPALSGSDPGAVVRDIIHFLDRHDTIDEIYGSDRELGEAIEKALKGCGQGRE